MNLAHVLGALLLVELAAIVGDEAVHHVAGVVEVVLRALRAIASQQRDGVETPCVAYDGEVVHAAGIHLVEPRGPLDDFDVAGDADFAQGVGDDLAGVDVLFVALGQAHGERQLFSGVAALL